MTQENAKGTPTKRVVPYSKARSRRRPPLVLASGFRLHAVLEVIRSSVPSVRRTRSPRARSLTPRLRRRRGWLGRAGGTRGPATRLQRRVHRPQDSSEEAVVPSMNVPTLLGIHVGLS